MKKFLFLFLFAATFIACSSDDDDTTGDDQILGTWVLVDASSPLDAIFCETPQSTISFDGNDTGEATFYLTEDECQPTESTGNWTNNGNSSYTIATPMGNLTGNVSFSGDDQFSFATAGGTLTFERL